jgi:hypothetical protein
MFAKLEDQSPENSLTRDISHGQFVGSVEFLETAMKEGTIGREFKGR